MSTPPPGGIVYDTTQHYVGRPPMAVSDLENRFAFHPATTQERRDEHEAVRGRALELAKWIDETVPAGREKSLAITHLEEVMFWANAAIARQGG